MHLGENIFIIKLTAHDRYIEVHILYKVSTRLAQIQIKSVNNKMYKIISFNKFIKILK